MENRIVINATALNTSGALTILKQFIEYVPEDEYEYIIFVDESVRITFTQKNISLIKKDVKSLRKRFQWDTFGLKKWLQINNFKPLVTISLQNTNFRCDKSIPNFIYYHNSIPFFNKNWNPFKKEEKILWFYKTIYPFFIKLYINQNTEVFVQTNSIKQAFVSYFNFPKEKVHIISPKIVLPKTEEAVTPVLDKKRLNLFYPATAFIYKNHKVIFEALSILEEELQKNITLHLTCEKDELINTKLDLKKLFQVNFLGKMPFSGVIGMYLEADALLFPSYIETIGLPLIEAASLGLPIIVADLPYSHNLLINYEGARFASHNDIGVWRDEISKLPSIKGRRFKPILIEKSNSWEELFQIVKNKIQ